jgi:hypothetical protein
VSGNPYHIVALRHLAEEDREPLGGEEPCIARRREPVEHVALHGERHRQFAEQLLHPHARRDDEMRGAVRPALGLDDDAITLLFPAKHGLASMDLRAQPLGDPDRRADRRLGREHPRPVLEDPGPPIADEEGREPLTHLGGGEGLIGEAV